MNFIMQADGLGLIIALAMGIYFYVTQKLRVEEGGDFMSIVSKRLKR